MQVTQYDLCLHVGQADEAANDWFIELKRGFNEAGVRVMAFSLDPGMGVEWRKKGMNDFIVLLEHKGAVDNFYKYNSDFTLASPRSDGKNIITIC